MGRIPSQAARLPLRHLVSMNLFCVYPTSLSRELTELPTCWTTQPAQLCMLRGRRALPLRTRITGNSRGMWGHPKGMFTPYGVSTAWNFSKKRSTSWNANIISSCDLFPKLIALSENWVHHCGKIWSVETVVLMILIVRFLFSSWCKILFLVEEHPGFIRISRFNLVS